MNRTPHVARGSASAALLALLIGASLAIPHKAMAQESVQGSVNNVVDFQDRGVAWASREYAATESKIAQSHGFGPANVTSNSTTNIAAETNYLNTTNNGGQTQTSVANSINSSTDSTSTTVGSNDSNFVILPTTTTGQTNGSGTRQAATGQTLTTGTGNPTVDSTSGNN